MSVCFPLPAHRRGKCMQIPHASSSFISWDTLDWKAFSSTLITIRLNLYTVSPSHTCSPSGRGSWRCVSLWGCLSFSLKPPHWRSDRHKNLHMCATYNSLSLAVNTLMKPSPHRGHRLIDHLPKMSTCLL